MIQPGVYRHYAGKLYYVLTTAKHTETGEELVIYIPLYAHKHGGIVPQARPAKMWTEIVSGGKGTRRGVVPRFDFVGATLPPGEKQ